MKKFISTIMCLILFLIPVITASAATVQHTVIKGESMWKIAVKYQVGLSEIINANSQIKNPALIYPGEVLNIPLTDPNVTSYEKQVADIVNQERAKNGLPALTLNWQLSRVARLKSQDMHDKHYFAHQSPTYGSPFDMMKKFGITFNSAGENIAMGYATPQAVMTGWMNSPGHRANILNSSYTQIGVGYVADGNYWTQEFTG